MKTLHILVKQRRTPLYRRPLADVLSDAKVFEGKKVQVAWMSDTPGLFGICHYCYRIIRERPQVIIAETWSDKYCFLIGLLLSRLLGIRYVSWSLVKPPFEKLSPKFLLGVTVLKLCDHHICYSTYGASILTELGIPAERTSVVLNVGLSSFFKRNRYLEIDERCRRVVKRNKYRIGYVGSIGKKKRFFDLVWAVNEANMILKTDKFALICAVQHPSSLKISREEFPGIKYLKIFRNVKVERLPIFYGIVDALFVPGQGGQVVSEGLVSHVPVFVGEGDGTQFDLVRPGCGQVASPRKFTCLPRKAILDLVLDIPKTFQENAIRHIEVPDHLGMRDQILRIARKVYEDNDSLS